MHYRAAVLQSLGTPVETRLAAPERIVCTPWRSVDARVWFLDQVEDDRFVSGLLFCSMCYLGTPAIDALGPSVARSGLLIPLPPEVILAIGEDP